MKSPQPRVLVVNSNREMGLTIANILSNEGFSVVAAEEERSTLCKIASGDFSIIVLEKCQDETRDNTDIVRQARVHHPALKALYLCTRPDRTENSSDLDSCLFAPFRLRELIGCMWELYYRGVQRRVAAVPRLDVELCSATRSAAPIIPWVAGRTTAVTPAKRLGSEASAAAARQAAAPGTISLPGLPARGQNADPVDAADAETSRPHIVSSAA